MSRAGSKEGKEKDKPQKSSAPNLPPKFTDEKLRFRKGVVNLPQSLGEYHGGFSVSEAGYLAGTEALFTMRVYLQDDICELVLESPFHT